MPKSPSGVNAAIFFAGYDISGETRQYGVDLTKDELDATGLGHGVKNSQPGLPAFAADMTVMLDPDTGRSIQALESRVGSNVGFVFSLLLGVNAAPTIGDYAIVCRVLEFAYSIKHVLTDFVLANVVFSNKGGVKIDVNTRVLANTTVTNTTNFATVNNGASSPDGGTGYIQVVGALAADTYANKIQDSSNDSDWADLLTFAADSSARTSERKTVAGTIDQYTRGQVTRTGAAGNNYKLAMMLARN